ncbi:MAG: Rpn family recombination-promoting nuclease/putative transposase [Candidatus Falkowbacteria bacterium]
MTDFTNNPHDRIFRTSLSNVEVAKDFLKTHLPRYILNSIKLNSLSICPNSYITADLAESLSDILYQVKTITTGVDCYLYTLIEHQSDPTWDMPIRIMQYQLAIINNHLKQYPKTRKLPIVVPLLVYNGKRSPYPYDLDIIDLFSDKELAKRTFGKPAALIDVTDMSDEIIKKHNIIGLLEFVQKHVRDRKFLTESIKILVQIINTLDNYVKNNKFNDVVWFKDYIAGNLHYLYYFGNIVNDIDFSKELEQIEFIKKENVMGALARKIEADGIQKGKTEKAKATALVLLQEGIEHSVITKSTGLSEEELVKLKTETNN